MSIFVFVFGLAIGSFLNALIYRLHSRQSIFEKHSQCPHCKHDLAVWDLIPVVSFFMLRGKCRYCGKKISWQYPVVEISTAIAFFLVYSNVFASAGFIGEITNYKLQITNLVFQLIFSCFLIVIFVYDLKHYLILDKVVFPAAVLAIVYQLWQGELLYGLLGAVILSGFFGLLYLVSHGKWIGMGDIKLGLFLGFLVPYPQTIALFFLAYFFGAAVALPLVLFANKKMADQIPFGMFLTFAAFVAMLWGEGIISWYFKLIGIY